MTHVLTIKDPQVVAGLAVLVFSGIVAFEGLQLFSVPELILAASLAVLGWLLRRRGLRPVTDVGVTVPRQLRSRWLRFCMIGLPAAIGAYILGYFVLMDRHLPTYPHDRGGWFESSFRWAGLEPRPGMIPETRSWPFPNVTIWNLIYRPMDTIYFQFRPRTDAEIELLRRRGWSW
jgi:hypothetical protein